MESTIGTDCSTFLNQHLHETARGNCVTLQKPEATNMQNLFSLFSRQRLTPATPGITEGKLTGREKYFEELPRKEHAVDNEGVPPGWVNGTQIIVLLSSSLILSVHVALVATNTFSHPCPGKCLCSFVTAACLELVNYIFIMSILFYNNAETMQRVAA